MKPRALILSTWFDLADPTPLVVLPTDSAQWLDCCVRDLAPGGLLFVYGAPWRLAAYGVHLRRSLTFKYWISLELRAAPTITGLQPTHLGLLLFWKPDGQFVLATDAARIPHPHCAACAKTLRDWGGKRHLMNPRGTVLSDVWRDLPRRPITDQRVPNDVRKRVATLAGHAPQVVVEPRPALAAITGSETITYRHPPLAPPEEGIGLRIPLLGRGQGRVSRAPNGRFLENQLDATKGASASPPPLDQILHTDCVSFLDSLPTGVFDLCFADPPYNLAKLYSQYDDALAEQQYRDWCDRWLTGMARTLKPGGSLFVLNLPKWGLHHAVTLNQHLNLQRWIAWDALSDPRGKLMPAHYALLWYTKPGAPAVINDLPTIDAPDYCLRAGCIQKRKAAGDDRKVPLTDIWWDIHRIRHKRDRDHHPCQLPDKLLERIIRLTTQPGDVVFDPFGGTGTTGIVAKRLGRHFLLTELDPEYVKIARARLAHDAPRTKVARPRARVSKRAVELRLQALTRQLGHVPEENEIPAEILQQIDERYPYRSAALKRCRVVLEP